MKQIDPNTTGVTTPLAAACVTVVGVGGLGCPAIIELARRGVGHLVLIDSDVVELSNLNRQLLHRTSTIGMSKVDSAAFYLAKHFPAVAVTTHNARLTENNARDFFVGSDFVIDATDGVASKYCVNDAAVREGIPFSHAGVLGWRGQTLTVDPNQTACLRCLFPVAPAIDDLPTCREAGILGAVAGIIGALQADAACRVLNGELDSVFGNLLTWDGRTAHFRAVPVRRDPRCPTCGTAVRVEHDFSSVIAQIGE